MSLYEDNCVNATDICADNPMFDIPSLESVDIIWINDLNSELKFKADPSCLNNNSVLD